MKKTISVFVLVFGSFAGGPQLVVAQVATHTITVTQAANGTIAPDTTVVSDGSSQLFTIMPAAGFYITDVTVDGSSEGSHAARSFVNVTADHTITASFALIPLGADTIPGTVMDVSGPTTFTLDPGTPGPFVWFVVMNSNIKTINGVKTIVPGPTTLVIDRLGQLMSAGTTSGITPFRDQVVVSGRAEPDNGGLFPLSIIDNSVPAIPTPDTTAPVITLNGANPMNLTVGGIFTDPGATALDAVDGPVAVIASGAVDTTTAGAYTITYTAKDAALNTATTNRTVNVNPVPPTPDTTAPVITLNGSNPIGLTVGGAFVDPGATALDAVDGTVPVIATGAVDTTTVGAYIITYTATDAAQNVATATRTVNVFPAPLPPDTTAPVITCPPDLTVQCLRDVPPPDFAGGSVIDDSDPNPVVTHVGDVTIGINPTLITRTYQATDASGNTSSCTQTIMVQGLVGDLNGDCCVDRMDLNLLLAKIRARSTDLTYDINGDGKIDIADARFLVLHFSNPSGSPCSPKLKRRGIREHGN